MPLVIVVELILLVVFFKAYTSYRKKSVERVGKAEMAIAILIFLVVTSALWYVLISALPEY